MGNLFLFSYKNLLHNATTTSLRSTRERMRPNLRPPLPPWFLVRLLLPMRREEAANDGPTTNVPTRRWRPRASLSMRDICLQSRTLSIWTRRMTHLEFLSNQLIKTIEHCPKQLQISYLTL